MKYHLTKGEFESGWHILPIEEARAAGYGRYSFPCARIGEGQIVQNMIDDIEAHGRDGYCVVRLPGSMVEVWTIPNIFITTQKPYIFQKVEEDDEFYIQQGYDKK